MKKINEIFYSIQGEGYHAGTPAVFIRFSGCNLRCPFCDTKHQEGNQMTEEDIINEVKKYPAKLVVLTGGEPSLFIDEAFVKLLKDAGKYVAIETNGTRELPSNLDWITISPKTEYCKNANVVVAKCDEVKLVYRFQCCVEWVIDSIEADHYYLQPCDMGEKKLNEEIIAGTIKECKKDPRWRISLQTQKILNVR